MCLTACGIGLKMICVLFMDMSKFSAFTGEPLCRRRGLWKDCTVSVHVNSSFIALPHPQSITGKKAARMCLQGANGPMPAAHSHCVCKMLPCSSTLRSMLYVVERRILTRHCVLRKVVSSFLQNRMKRINLKDNICYDSDL